MMLFTPLSTVKIAIFLATLTCISAAPQFGLQGVQKVYTNEAPSPYDYQYKVEHNPTNTYYGKSESGDVTGKVTGSYYVYLPDGRLMTVDYLVDGESGFVPKVTFATQAYPGVRV